MVNLNIGVIGLGRFGQVYAKDIAHRIPNVNLVAVADKEFSVAQEFSQRYNVPAYYSDHNDLLADGNVDAVVVVTPTSTHKEMVIESAEVGKFIFCEKPISLSIVGI